MQIPQLTFLRFLAAFGVVLFHFGQSTWPFSAHWLLPLVEQAGLGVGFFFTLSGFLLAWVYAPQGKIALGTYSRARFARIYPLYLLTFLLTLGAEMLIRGTRPRGLSVILQGLGLHAWVPGYCLSINFPGWSVSVELFFYLAFPALLYVLRDRHWSLLLAIAALATLVSVLIFSNIIDWTQGWITDINMDFRLRFPLWHLPTFVIGMVGGLLFRAGKLRIAQPWLPTVLLLLTLGMLSTAYFPNWLIHHAANGLFAPVYVGMIVCLAQDQGPLARVLARAPFQFAGEMSYAVYLLQTPLYIALEPLAIRSGSTGLQGHWLWIYLAVLLMCSGLVYQFFERPMRQWLRLK